MQEFDKTNGKFLKHKKTRRNHFNFYFLDKTNEVIVVFYPRSFFFRDPKKKKETGLTINTKKTPGVRMLKEERG